jgi:hypothetical protein
VIAHENLFWNKGKKVSDEWNFFTELGLFFTERKVVTRGNYFN